jgi:hypothetical protein
MAEISSLSNQLHPCSPYFSYLLEICLGSSVTYFPPHFNPLLSLAMKAIGPSLPVILVVGQHVWQFHFTNGHDFKKYWPTTGAIFLEVV